MTTRVEREAYLRKRVAQVSDPVEWLIEACLLEHGRTETAEQRLDRERERSTWLSYRLRRELGVPPGAPLPAEEATK